MNDCAKGLRDACAQLNTRRETNRQEEGEKQEKAVTRMAAATAPARLLRKVRVAVNKRNPSPHTTPARSSVHQPTPS